MRQEQPDGLVVAAHARPVQRRHSVHGFLRLHVRASLKQTHHEILGSRAVVSVAKDDDLHERRHSVAIRLVRIGSVFEQGFCRGKVLQCQRQEQWRTRNRACWDGFVRIGASFTQ